MWTTLCRCLIALTLVTGAAACDDGPTDPTPIGTPGSLNLTGTWTGSLGPPGTLVVYQATWTAAQTGNAVSGNLALFRPTDNVGYPGTLAGTLTGTQLAVTYAVPRGSIATAPTCSIAGSGTLTASATLMSGRLSLTYSDCLALTAETSALEEFSLTKQ